MKSVCMFVRELSCVCVCVGIAVKCVCVRKLSVCDCVCVCVCVVFSWFSALPLKRNVSIKR